MFNFRNSKLGMTLVEMVISLVVLSILTTSTMGIIISSNNIFISTTSAALDRQVGGHVFETLSSIIKYSTHMNIYDSDAAPSTENAQSISIKDIDSGTNSGKIYFKHANSSDSVRLYDNSFYGTRTVQYSIQSYDEGNRHVKLTVRVFRDGKQRYELSRIIKCVNLGLVSTGDNANFINDVSTEGSINQYISFSINENLIDGDSESYSLEYKISEFMAKYNSIQLEYVSKLQQVYSEVNNVIGNTSDVQGERVSHKNFEDVLNMRSTAILGRKYDFNNNKDGHGAAVPGEKWELEDGETVYNYVNLRQHYQDEIKELLHFTPTAGITKSTDINPFYGVVATKEELYTGFLLEYYSENDKHEKVTKESYPTFSNKSFFDGTSIKSYLDNTKDNEMVILSYFKENTGENYDNLWSSSGKKEVYTFQGEETIGVANYGIICSSDENNQPGAASYAINAIKRDGKQIVGAYEGNGYCFSIETTNHTAKYRWWYKDSTTFMGMPVYNLHTNETKNSSDDAQKALSGSKHFASNSDAGISNLKTLTDIATQITTSSDYRVFKEDNSYCIVPLVDMPTGWYYYKDSDVYHFFYIYENPIFAADNPNHIAITKVSTTYYNAKASQAKVIIGYKECDKKNGLTAFTYNDINSGSIIFYQDIIGTIQPNTSKTETAEFYNVNAHQYIDYVLYSVDWNSWFETDNSKKGILNNLISNIGTFVGTILGTPAASAISEITGNNAVLCLGNRGQMNIDNIDTSLRSYNMAWAVYSPKRCTWYYIPESSTRLSQAISALSFTSSNDAPTPIDVDLNSGKTWTSSTAMVGNIDQKKLNSKGLFGIDTTTSIMWCSLPVSAGKVDTSSLVK